MNDSTLDQGGHEEKGAMEEQTQKIDAIVGDEVLGYEGSGREEHSGQKSATSTAMMVSKIASPTTGPSR